MRTLLIVDAKIREQVRGAIKQFSESFPDGQLVVLPGERETDLQILEEASCQRFQIGFNLLSARYIPDDIRLRFQFGLINFHPGPLDFPGVGSSSLALFAGNENFGVVAHYMEHDIDSGPVVRQFTFPIPTGATPESLTRLAHQYCEVLMIEILKEVAECDAPPMVDKSLDWTRAAVTREEFEEWLCLESFSEEHEISRKIRASLFPGKAGPYISVDGVKFYLNQGKSA